MDFDIKGYLIVLLLGIIVGLGYANIFDKDFNEAVSSVGALLAGVGAVGTLIVAAKALMGWKKESDYNFVMSKYEEGVSELEKYLSAVQRLHSHFLNVPSDESKDYHQWCAEMTLPYMECSFIETNINKLLNQMEAHLPRGVDEISNLASVISFFKEQGGYTRLLGGISWTTNSSIPQTAEVSAVVETYRSLRKELKDAF